MRIVSGGQTGVDRAALDAALECGLPCGGRCPRGRRAEDGRIDDRYPLEETESRTYRARTLANVRESQGTLIIVAGTDERLCGGTALTAREARRLGRPLFIAALGAAAGVPALAAGIGGWIADNDIAVLNVAGPRESTSPGIYRAAHGLMQAVFEALIRRRS